MLLRRRSDSDEKRRCSNKLIWEMWHIQSRRGNLPTSEIMMNSASISVELSDNKELVLDSLLHRG